VVKNGKDKNNKQRFLCRNEECNQQTFLMNYSRIGGRYPLRLWGQHSEIARFSQVPRHSINLPATNLDPDTSVYAILFFHIV
jgi:hypothetical protein